MDLRHCKPRLVSFETLSTLFAPAGRTYSRLRPRTGRIIFHSRHGVMNRGGMCRLHVQLCHFTLLLPKRFREVSIAHASLRGALRVDVERVSIGVRCSICVA